MKFRASFTTLNLWQQGRYQDAVACYFHLPTYKSPEMVDGSDWHKRWSQHINDTHTMPIEFGSAKLTNPITEVKKVVSVADWLDLAFIADLVDGSTIYEFKTGSTPSQSYLTSNQIGVYAVGLTLDKHFINRGEIHHYNQYSKKADCSYLWITDELLKDSLNWIETLASEMHQYLLTNNLYERFANAGG